MSEVIVVTSGKGGVGKTTTTANIGAGLARLGKKVVVVDMDIGLRNLDVALGLENRVVYNLIDVIEGNCRLKQALISDRNDPNLSMLPAAQMRDQAAVSERKMKKLVLQLEKQFDFILLDCPAGIEQGFYNAVSPASRALVVTTPEVSAIRNADRVIRLLENAGIKKVNLIINRFRVEMASKGILMSVEDVTDLLTVDLIGVVPEDDQVMIATNHGETLVYKDSLAARAYQNICRRICGEEVPFLDLKQKKGFFQRFFKDRK